MGRGCWTVADSFCLIFFANQMSVITRMGVSCRSRAETSGVTKLLRSDTPSCES